MIMVAEVRTRWRRVRVRTRAFLGRGGRDMMEGSTGSTPRDWAGGPSMRMSEKMGQYYIIKWEGEIAY
jgi:hypothetical protein